MNSATATGIAIRPPSLQVLGDDLLRVSVWERCVTILAPFAAMGWCAFFSLRGWWVAAGLAVAFLSFVTYGSTSHDLVHRNLGLSRRLNELLLEVIEGLSLRSGRAYRRSHLHHHRRFPHADDVEASSAGSLALTLAGAPIHQARLWCWAWRRFPGDRLVLISEAAWIALAIVGAIAVLPWTAAPLVYAALVIAGSWAFPLVTVYVPHDPRGRDTLRQTRLFRGRVLSLIALDHLYHLEHHLYPAVPHPRWKQLAERLDPFFESAAVRPKKLVA